MQDGYKTVGRAASDEFVEKKSRFIGHCFPVTTEEEALAHIARIKKEYWDARHNTYAYVLRGGMIRRFSDDGEPQGTAGMPMLEVLTAQGLEDCLVVVTRYFGGILLGTGGLVRAYSHATAIAVQAAGAVRMLPCREGRVVCPYPQYQPIATLVEAVDGKVADTVFADTVTICYELPTEYEADFDRRLTDLTCGSVQADKGELVIRPFACE